MITENKGLFSMKDILKSFEYWPQIFKFIWKTDKTYLIIIFILSVVQGFVPSISIVVTQNLINAIQVGSSKGKDYIVAPFLIYVLITALAAMLGQIKSYFEDAFQIKLSFKTELAIVEKAVTLELKNFEDSNVYDMLRRAQNNTGNRAYMVFSQILSLLSQVITLFSTAALLIIWKWWIILVILIIPITSSLYSIKIGNLQYKIQKERAQEQRKSWYISYILTNDIAFKEIKLYRLSKYFIDKFIIINKVFIKQDKKIIGKRTNVNLIFEILDQGIGAFVLFLIIQAAFIGEILIGSTIAYIRCVSGVQGSTAALLSNLVSIYQNNLYINQFFEFLNLPIENGRLTSGLTIDNINTIELINVSYKYKNRDKYSLRNINFTLNSNDKIAVVGHNGSGKTTLVKIISGFYDDYEGDILVNGINLRELNLDDYRNKIGIVFQDYSKYELTLRENIGVGHIDSIENDKLLLNALDNANGGDILRNLSSGLENQLGVWFKDGVQLSGGQWQKLALSRAFLRKADIYILDEPSSALDPIAEYDMLCKCCELMKNNIGIFITHRLFNIKRMASKIVVLNNGEVVEAGLHDDLMSKEGHYAYLYNMQNADEEIIEQGIVNY